MFLFQFIYVVFLSVCWLAINPQVYMCLAFLRIIFFWELLKKHMKLSGF